MSELLASVDGAIAPAHEPTISILDEGFLRGDGAFEVCRVYRGVAFALDDHLARLQRSADGIRLEYDLVALKREITALLEESGPVEALIRIVITRGGRRIAIMEPLPPTPETAKIATITFSPNRLLDGLKTLSYAANMLAVRVAKEQGADEALLVTPHGRVLEGPTWSFFWVDDAGNLFTPPLEDRILRSITREKLLEVTPAQERITTLDDLAGVQEAFIASSLREGLPISHIDGRALPLVAGPVTKAAQAALRECIEAAI
jgi:branched-chain amino acid aminotransferase